ncbi:MAG: MFS transporter [Janthinobacterium lividum]
MLQTVPLAELATMPPVKDGQSRLYLKITRRLIPILFLSYTAAYVDRVNVGFAKLQMLSDLHFSEATYGLGAGIFFVGYFLFEVPSNIVLSRIGARRWIASIMLIWSVFSLATIFVRTPLPYYLLRFGLGATEAGLFPGIILYLTYWYPPSRRGKVISLFMTGIPVSGLIGGPLSGWILHSMSGSYGIAGWRWLFMLEATPSVIMSLIIFLFLDDDATQAKWLSPVERDEVAERVLAEHGDIVSHSMRDGFANPMVWIMSAIYLCFTAGLYAVGFWLPTLIKGIGVKDTLSVGLLSAIPYLAATIAMIVVGRSSDRRRERRWHITVPALVGLLGWIISIRFEHDIAIAMIGLTIATIGVMTTVSQFWCLPTGILTGAAAAVGVAIINSIGNLSGALVPYLVGIVVDATKSTDLAVYMLASIITVGGLCVLTIPKHLTDR